NPRSPTLGKKKTEDASTGAVPPRTGDPPRPPGPPAVRKRGLPPVRAVQRLPAKPQQHLHDAVAGWPCDGEPPSEFVGSFCGDGHRSAPGRLRSVPFATGATWPPTSIWAISPGEPRGSTCIWLGRPAKRPWCRLNG